jgi:hypothetical protein
MALKPVDKKSKPGLVKLPTAVRNKMGYAKKGGSTDFIQKAIKKPGALHEQMGVPKGKKIPAKALNKAAKAPGKLGQRARFAQLLKGFKKGK